MTTDNKTLAVDVLAVTTCETCGGTGYVGDGEINSYPDGTPYLCGPVKCIKDCPNCSAHPSPSSQQAVATVVRKGFNSGALAWTDFGLRSDLQDGTSLYTAQPHKGWLGNATHQWPEVDRVLTDAYMAGSEGNEFDMIAARKAIYTALARIKGESA